MFISSARKHLTSYFVGTPRQFSGMILVLSRIIRDVWSPRLFKFIKSKNLIILEGYFRMKKYTNSEPDRTDSYKLMTGKKSVSQECDCWGNIIVASARENGIFRGK